MTFRDRLDKAIAESGMTQTQLARLAGMTPAAVSRWRSGEREITSVDAVKRLAEALNVDAAWLAWGTGKDN